MPCSMCQKEHSQTIPEALSLLAKTAKRLESLTGRLTPRRAAVRPAPDKWSVNEIVNHLSDCEVVYGVRYRKIAAEPGASLVAFDQDAWAGGLCYGRQPLKTTLACFSGLRAANVALLKSLPDAAWQQNGVHPEYGTLILRDLVLHIAEHDRGHLARLEELCLPAPAAPRKNAPKKSRTRR